MVGDFNGDRVSPDDVARHPLLRDIMYMVERCGRMIDMAKLSNDPEWLRLPASRRQQALRRHEALLEYIQGEPTGARAKAAAKKAGISVRSLYNFVPAWNLAEGPDIWTLVPHWKNKAEGQSRLDPDTERTMRAVINNVVNDGLRGTKNITDATAARWPKDGPPMPSLPTIRHHVDGRGGFDIVEKGSMSLNTGAHAQETGETARRYGEVLVVDHSGLDLFLDSPKSPKRATVTFAIDLFTASIAGFTVSAFAPKPELVIDVLDDAEIRSANNPGEPIVPRLLFAGTNGHGWRDLVDTIEKRGLEATIRWGTNLHFGGPIRRMIGTKLADLQLHARKRHARSGANDSFDPTRHALVTVPEAKLVVADAVNQLNAERMVGQQITPLKTKI